MRTWIFQGNPDLFDIDGYLAIHPTRFVWLVTRYADEMLSGDRVFIYRTGAEAGVIAEAEIIGAPSCGRKIPKPCHSGVRTTPEPRRSFRARNCA